MAFKKRALLTLVLNLGIIVLAHLYYYYDLSLFLQNLTGGLLLGTTLVNYEFISKDNKNLAHSENLKIIANHVKVLYLLYSFVAIVALYFFTLNQKLGNFQLFMTMYYFGMVYSGLSLYTFKQDFNLINIPNRLPLIRYLLRFIIITVGITLFFGMANIIFNFGSIVSIGSGLMLSAGSFYVLLGLFPLWLIPKRIYDKQKEKIRYWILNIAGIILILLFLFPLVSMPWTFSNANAQFQEEFGNNWRTENGEGNENLIESPFKLSTPFFGEENQLAEGIDYDLKTNIIYKNETEYQLYYNIYYPTPSANEEGFGYNKTIIFVHGGGWVGGTKNNSPHLLKYFAAQGYVVFAIDYRLTDINLLDAEAEIGFDIPDMESSDLEYLNGPYRIPDMMKDIGDFTHHLASLSDEERMYADINDVIFLGQSAGAYLSALVGFGYNHPRFMGNFSQSLNITNLILYYPPIFADHFFYGHKAFHNEFQMIPGTPETNPDDYHYLTPTNLIDENDPPALLLHGTFDDLVPIENSDAVKMEMNNIGLSCIQIKIPFIGHGFTNNPQYHSLELFYLERWLLNA